MVTPFNVILPMIDVNAKCSSDAFGATRSNRMDFSDVDRAPMNALNEIIWKSVKGADDPMPSPVHRFRPIVDANNQDRDEN